jgi:TonB family protein
MRGALAAIAFTAACGAAKPDVIAMRNDTTGDGPAKLTSRDTAVIRQALRGPVVDAGMWFDDAACRARFAKVRLVPVGELDDLARCLATLQLSRSARQGTAQVAILDTHDGIELEARFPTSASGSPLLSIGFIGAREASGWVPTISPEALEARRVAGDPHASDPAAVPTLDGLAASDPRGTVVTQLRVCIGADGAVASAHALLTSSSSAAQLFAGAIHGWRFRPLVLGGQTLAACSVVTLGHPWDKAKPSLVPVEPAPLDRGTEGVAMGRLVGPAGEWLHMSVAPGTGVSVSARYCTDATGHVDRVEIYDSSGSAELDRRVLQMIREWRFTPATVDGKPARACAATEYLFQ